MSGEVGEERSTPNHEARWPSVERDDRRRRIGDDGDPSDSETGEPEEKAADRHRISEAEDEGGEDPRETKGRVGDDIGSLSRREVGECAPTMFSGSARANDSECVTWCS